MAIDEPSVVDIEKRVASFHVANPDPDIGYPLFNEMREKCPIAHSEQNDGFWVLTRYDDIREAMKHPETFSSRIHGIPPVEGVKLIPLNYDPPEHTFYRNQFAALLSPAVANSVAPDARARLRELLHSFVSAGGGDFIADVAVPYPCVTFLELLGLPVKDLAQLLEWKDLMMRGLHSGDPERIADVFANVLPKTHGYFQERISEREAMAEEDRPLDLINAIIHARHPDGAEFTMADKISTLDLFFQAGLDTVTGLLGFIMEFLATHPDHRRQLIEDPSLIPNAVEEFFRYFGIVTTFRQVMHDTEFRGVNLHEGEYVMVLFQAAGRDPAEYSDPETVDFRRPDIRHLGLGGGPHRCIGSHLARVELQLALEEILAIMPDFTIVGDPTEVKRHWGVVAGLDALPLAPASS